LKFLYILVTNYITSTKAGDSGGKSTGFHHK